MLMSLIGWLVLGLIAGGLARLLHPGRDSMGIGATIVLGVLGSFLGGGIAYLLGFGRSPYEPGGWILATVGAIILLAAGVFAAPRRGLTS